MCTKGNNSKYTNNYIDIQFKAHSNLHQVLDIRIKFVNDLRQVGGFSPDSPVFSTINTDRHKIKEMLLKVALYTVTHKLIIVHPGFLNESLPLLQK